MTGAASTENELALPASLAQADAVSPQSASNRNHPNQRTSLLILCVVAALYLAFAIHLLRAELAGTSGQLTYPLDDTYITMAMAKNLALHGVWGITPAAFAPSSSCPGFLLILATVYRLTAPTVWWSLALSLSFGLLGLFAASRLLRGVPIAIQTSALIAIVLFTPLHVMGLLGMEHTLHLALIILFLDAVGNAVAAKRRLPWAALLLTAAMVSVRYESLFMVAVAGLLFLGHRQIRAAFELGIAAAAPVAIYGIASVLHGGYWLPNSIALKGASTRAVASAPMELVRHFEQCIIRAPHLGALVLTMLALLAVPAVVSDKRARAMLDLVIGATLIHLTLADVDWVYRYEAYLVAAAIVVIALALSHVKISRDRWAAAAILIFGVAGVWLLSQRALAAEHTIPQRSVAIYSQQIQMARFLKNYEEGASVAANDVGAINYYADINCLDLVGLGDRDVFRLKHQGIYTTPNLRNLAASRGVQIAIVYDTWFTALPLSQFSGPPLPASWIRVARWRTPYGSYLGSDIVSFYATTPTEADKLQHDLSLFAPTLPPGVLVVNRGEPMPHPDSTH